MKINKVSLLSFLVVAQSCSGWVQPQLKPKSTNSCFQKKTSSSQLVLQGQSSSDDVNGHEKRTVFSTVIGNGVASFSLTAALLLGSPMAYASEGTTCPSPTNDKVCEVTAVNTAKDDKEKGPEITAVASAKAGDESTASLAQQVEEIFREAGVSVDTLAEESSKDEEKLLATESPSVSAEESDKSAQENTLLLADAPEEEPTESNTVKEKAADSQDALLTTADSPTTVQESNEVKVAAGEPEADANEDVPSKSEQKFVEAPATPEKGEPSEEGTMIASKSKEEQEPTFVQAPSEVKADHGEAPAQEKKPVETNA